MGEREQLFGEIRAYPKFDFPEVMEKEFQSEITTWEPDFPDVSPIKVCSLHEKPLEAIFSEPISAEDVLFEELPFLDVSFTESDHNVAPAKLLALDFGDWTSDHCCTAKPQSCAELSKKDKEELAFLLKQRIFQIEQEMAEKKGRTF